MSEWQRPTDDRVRDILCPCHEHISDRSTRVAEEIRAVERRETVCRCRNTLSSKLTWTSTTARTCTCDVCI